MRYRSKVIISLLIVVFLLASIMLNSILKADARTFDKEQKQLADKMANYCISHWKEYGVLPSVCVAQAMQESQLGKHCSAHNYWGICSCRISFSDDESGMRKYCQIINNGCYKGAPFCKDWSTQISRILAGGYCEPVGNYYNDVAFIVNAYDLTRYDHELFESLKPRPKRKRTYYRIIYKPSVPSGFIEVPKKEVGKVASVYIYNTASYLECVPGGTKNVLYTSDKSITGHTQYIEFINAKG